LHVAALFDVLDDSHTTLANSWWSTDVVVNRSAKRDSILLEGELAWWLKQPWLLDNR